MDGPAFGIKVCLEGPSKESQAKFEELNKTRQAAYDKALSRIKEEGFRKTEHIQWFVVGDDFAPMGVKMIGEFCMEIRDEAGGKMLARFSTWSSEWRGIQLWVYPDMEAYHKVQIVIGRQGMNTQRYWDTDVTLGFDWPTS